MKQQNEQLREVELRISLSTVEEWGLEALVSIWTAHESDLRLRGLSCRGSHVTVLIETSGSLDTEAFNAIEYITDLRLVGHGPNRYEYLLETEAPTCGDSLDECEGEFFVTDEVTVSETGIEFTVVATHAGIKQLDVGGSDPMGVELLSLSEYTGREEPLDSLTDRQRTVLETAYAIGYYAVPRRVSSDDLAAELGLEKSTVLEHLRRAERNVLSELLGEVDRPSSRSQRAAHPTAATNRA